MSLLEQLLKVVQWVAENLPKFASWVLAHLPEIEALVKAVVALLEKSSAYFAKASAPAV